MPAVRTTDIYQHTDEIDKLEKDIQDAIIGMAKMEKQAATLEAKLSNLTATTSQQRQQISTTAQQAVELDNRYKQYNATLNKASLELAKVKLATQEQNKANKLAVQLANSASGSYDQMKARLAVVTRELRKMGKEQRTTTEAGRRLLRESQKLTAELRRQRIEAGTNTGAMGRLARSFRTFTSAVKQAFIVGGLTGVIITLTRFVGSAVNIFSSFQRQISLLGAISSATRDELAALEQDARRLGESTEFTARQVAQLQTVFARGGFNPKEILDATEATLNLALTTGTELADAALVVSSNIRAYGLEAKETAKFTDTLTATLNSANLQLEDYAEASKELAPIARLLGVSAEEGSAAIGLLADNGLRGTAATTTLSSGLLKLSDSTKKYAKEAEAAGIQVFNQNGEFVGLAELLSNINEATKNLTEQERLATLGRIVGIRSARSFAILLNAQKEVITETGREVLRGGEALAGYAAQLDRASGSAAEAARLIGDNLTGDLKELASAAEGAQINFISFFNDGIRKVVQGITGLISGVNEFLSIPLSETIKEQQAEFNSLVGALISTSENIEDVNVREEVQSSLISELNAKYPEFIGNLDLQTATTEQLTEALSQANDQFTRKIILQRQEEELNEIFQKRATLIEDLIRFQEEQASGAVRLRRNVLGGGIGDQTVEQDIARTQRQIADLDRQAAEVTSRRSRELELTIGLLDDQGEAASDLAEDLANVGTAGSAAGERTKKGFQAAAGSITFLKEELRKLNQQLLGSTVDQQEGLLIKITDAEKAVEMAEEALAMIRRRIDQQKGFQILAPLDPEPLEAFVRITDEARANSLSEAFDQYQALEESRFHLVERSEAEIRRFRIQQEKERLAETLRLNLVTGDAQVEIVKNQILALDRELKDIAGPAGGESRSIFDYLGIDLSEGQLSAAKGAFDFVKQQLADAAQFRKQLADQRLEDANEAVEQAQRNLQIELANEENRSRARIQIRERELQEANTQQARAQRERDRALRAERRANTIQQSQNLITASSKIWSQFGFPLAIPFIATMFGSFITAKIRANQLARQDAKHGFFEKIATHDSHASGNDKPMWVNNSGKQIFAEKGEVSTIFPIKTVKHYGPRLPEIIKSLFALNFEDQFMTPGHGSGTANISLSAERFDDRRLIDSINRLGSSGKRNISRDPGGRQIDTWGRNQRITHG